MCLYPRFFFSQILGSKFFFLHVRPFQKFFLSQLEKRSIFFYSLLIFRSKWHQLVNWIDCNVLVENFLFNLSYYCLIFVLVRRKFCGLAFDCWNFLWNFLRNFHWNFFCWDVGQFSSLLRCFFFLPRNGKEKDVYLVLFYSQFQVEWMNEWMQKWSAQKMKRWKTSLAAGSKFSVSLWISTWQKCLFVSVFWFFSLWSL